MRDCVRYTTGTFFYTLVLVVPVLSVALWGLKFELVWSDLENNLKAWLFVYSASGIFQLINYFKVVRLLMLTLLDDNSEADA